MIQICPSKKMTRYEILSMKPGREMDVIVAEKVMGLDNIHKANYEIYSYGVLLAKPGDYFAKLDDKWISLPRYSTDISAAWEVVEELKNLGYGVSVYEQNGVSVKVEVFYDMFGGQFHSWRSGERLGVGNTASEAICKAALAVMEL